MAARADDGADTGPGARVVVYTRQGCHLCDDALAVVAPLAAEAATTVRLVDVDDDAVLRDRFGELVPVVEVDGVQQGFWRVDADRVRRALADGAR